MSLTIPFSLNKLAPSVVLRKLWMGAENPAPDAHVGPVRAFGRFECWKSLKGNELCG